MREGMPVDSRGDVGVTALMRASLKGYTDVVAALLEAGADMDAVDLGGASALHLAVRRGNVDIVKLLLQEDALVDIPDNEGWTPLMRASVEHKSEIMPVLLAQGADPLKVNNWKENTFTLAIKSNDPATLALLVDSPHFAKLSAAQKAALREEAEAQDNTQMVALLSPKPPAPPKATVVATAPKTKKPVFGFLSFFSFKQESAPLAIPVVSDAVAKTPEAEPATPSEASPPLMEKVSSAPLPAPVATPVPETARIAVGEAIRVPVSGSNTSSVPAKPVVPVATAFAPSNSKSLKNTHWLHIGPYANEAAALAAYNAVRTNPVAGGLRVRVLTSVDKTLADVSLSLGPTSVEQASRLCAALREQKRDLSCAALADFGKSVSMSAVPGGYDSYVHPHNRANPALARLGKYWLQFGTYSSEESAVAARELLLLRHSNLTRGIAFAISVPDGSSSRRATYRLRGGKFASQEAATTACQAFKQRGVGCIVVSG